MPRVELKPGDRVKVIRRKVLAVEVGTEGIVRTVWSKDSMDVDFYDDDAGYKDSPWVFQTAWREELRKLPDRK